MKPNSSDTDKNNSSKFEIESLVAKYKGGDEEAFNTLFSMFEKSIASLASKYKASYSTSVSAGELRVEGAIALEEAVKKHDPNYPNANFSTFAIYMIKRAMKNFISESSLIKMPRDKRQELNKVRKLIKNAEMLEGRYLTHEEKLLRLMESMRAEYVAKKKEHKLYLDAKYRLEEVETYQSPCQEITPELSDSSLVGRSVQDMVDDSIFIRLIGNKLKGLNDLHSNVAALLCAGYKESEIRERLSISTKQFTGILNKIKKTLLEDEYISDKRRYAERKYKWKRGEKNKSKYRKTRYSEDELSYLMIRLFSFYQDAEKISSSYAPKLNRLQIFRLVAEYIGKKVVDTSMGEDGEVTEKVMYDHFNKIVSIFPASSYENNPNYVKYIIPVVKGELDDLPLESYVFFAALLSSYLEDTGSGKSLKEIIKSKNFFEKDYRAWRIKVSKHLHELMEKCIEYMCNEALTKYNADKINSQYKATGNKKKIEQLSEVYELASEQVKQKAINEIAKLTHAHHSHYNGEDQMAHFKCFEELMDIVRFILSDGKASYADERDKELQNILAKLRENPNKKSRLKSLESHLSDIIADYRNGSEDAESHIFNIFVLHRKQCLEFGNREIENLVMEVDNIIDEHMHTNELHNAEYYATELIKRYKYAKESKNESEVKNVEMLSAARGISDYLRDYKKQYESPVLNELLDEMVNIENEHRAQLESVVDSELHQLAEEMYVDYITELVHDYHAGVDGSLEAITDFLVKYKVRFTELGSQQINILINKLDAIAISH